ncbi:MAG: phage portal protein [Peptostreptococcaceae bacterium]
MELVKVMNDIIAGKDLNVKIHEHKMLLETLIKFLDAEKEDFNKMYDYYKGDTDALSRYKMISKRSNLKVNVNYLKKFIKEEVSYAVGNPLTYDCDDQEVAKTLIYNLQHWDENHDEDLMKYLLVFTKVYELYYIDEVTGEFNSRIVTPLDGYAYCDDAGKPVVFIRRWKNILEEDKSYIDVYTRKSILHLNDKLEEVMPASVNKFGEVPVSVGTLTKEGVNDSLYKDCKGLQDAIETNLSDIANEISDFRNAYLLFKGCKIDKAGLEQAKELGIMQTGEPKSSIEWLIKNINDTFIQNTLDRYVDTLYQITNHINHNDKLASNISGLALRSRLIALEQKCTLNINSHKNVVKNRIRLLCAYLNRINLLNDKFDYKNIVIEYTPNIPQDDLMTAQTLSQLQEGVISKATSRSQFSFINNPAREKELCEEEAKQELDLLGDNYVNENTEQEE